MAFDIPFDMAILCWHDSHILRKQELIAMAKKKVAKKTAKKKVAKKTAKKKAMGKRCGCSCR